jgi:hypothetical protein
VSPIYFSIIDEQIGLVKRVVDHSSSCQAKPKRVVKDLVNRCCTTALSTHVAGQSFLWSHSHFTASPYVNTTSRPHPTSMDNHYIPHILCGVEHFLRRSKPSPKYRSTYELFVDSSQSVTTHDLKRGKDLTTIHTTDNINVWD